MAAAPHRGPLTPDAAPRRRLGVLGWTALLLALLLLAVVSVQWMQFRLLRQAVRVYDDYTAIAVYQAESEYWRLREQWRLTLAEPQAAPLGELQQRFEIWVSRLALLREGQASTMIRSEDSRRTLAQAQALIARIDQQLLPGTAWPAALAEREWPALQALGPALHGLSLEASHQIAIDGYRRAQAVHDQSVLGLVLAATLTLMTVGFAALALTQLRQSRQRRQALEETTQRLHQAQHEAQAASDAKSAFLANMSHEIRTPFHGLMGMLSLLRDSALDATQRAHLRTATESAEHLLVVLDDILDMSQLESGRLVLAPAAVDLRRLLHETEALMRPQADAKGLALHVDTAPDVPERILADGTRLRQIVFNLLSNAIKFSERGSVVLAARCRHGADGGAPLLELCVSDTGIGMDEATLALLFNRFMQADTTRTRRRGGSGLGLQISRTLARLMDGDLTVDSRPGHGSTFCLQLPLRLPAPALPAEPSSPAGAGPSATAADAGAPAAAGGEPAPGPRDAAPARALLVLVAEDHAVNREYLAAVLARLGHPAVFVDDGQAAVEAARTQAFDVVLMDLHMPLLDGFGATRAIRALADPLRSTVPVIALTADAFSDTRERCIVAGMNGFLGKPVRPEDLATALRRLFGTEALAAPGAAAASPAPVDPAAAPANPLLDEAVLQQAMQALSPARYARSAGAYLDHLPEVAGQLRHAVRDAQTQALREHAHAARGAALHLGLAAVAETLLALEQGADRLPAHEIARLVQRIETLASATHAALQDRRYQTTGSGSSRMPKRP